MLTSLRTFLSPLNWLLLFVPFAIVVWLMPGWKETPLLFVVSAVGIVPLAGLMGRATEQIADRSGAGLGGFLNATFGNAAELIIGLVALSKGLTDVVKASLTGSIIGNLLLVLGGSMLAGGIRFQHQRFNRTAARAAGATLSIAAFAIAIPTVFHVTAAGRPGGWSLQAEQQLSVALAVVLLLTYVSTLVFSLVTHKSLFMETEEVEVPDNLPPLGISIGVLAVATALVGVLSESLLDSLEAAMLKFGFTETFVGIIIVAFIGNAAEHSTAVTAALRGRMDLSIGISMGSSTQVALFVTPVLLLCSYGFGKPMDLEFSLPEISAIVGSVWAAQQISGDGESNWLEGVQLLALYVIIGILFFFLPAAG